MRSYLGMTRFVPRICNYDINPLSAAAMLSLWAQGVADPSIVVIKLLASESMVTCLRIKQAENGRKEPMQAERLKAKGRTH